MPWKYDFDKEKLNAVLTIRLFENDDKEQETNSIK
jgi:hypothetical protein